MDIKTFPVRILGYKSGIGKSSGKPYWNVMFSCKLDDGLANQVTGEEVKTQVITEELYKKVIKFKPLDIAKGIVTRSGLDLSLYDIILS